MAIETDILLAQRARSSARTIDGQIAWLAAGQHGVVNRRQLLMLGLSPAAISRRLQRGLLHPLHLGVYAVGHPTVVKHGLWMGSVLAGPSGTVVSHRAAAALHGVRGGSMLEITAPTACRRRGIIVHREALPADETTVVDGIPATTITRTHFDLAAVVPPHQFERALREAEYRRLVDSLSLDDLVARHPRRPGIATIRRVLGAIRAGAGRSKSELEALFLAFLDRHGLPRPHLNVLAAGMECDCVWPRQRVVVELDSWEAHASRAAFERDREKLRRLRVAGWEPIAVTWLQIKTSERALAADLRALLTTAAAAASPSW